MGHHPLMFFLKCMNDASELDDLVRREIEARQWFLLCESDNSRSSLWVQKEVELVKSLEKTIYRTVDLDADLVEQLRQATELTTRATVFLSYAHDADAIAKQIAYALRIYDFGVSGLHDDLPSDASWSEQMSKAIQDAAKRGFVVICISPGFLTSEWGKEEIRQAIAAARTPTAGSSGAPHFNLLPVLLPGAEHRDLASLGLEDIVPLDMRTGDMYYEARRLVSTLIHMAAS